MRFYVSFNWKTIKKILIPIGIAIVLFLGFNTMAVHAQVQNGDQYLRVTPDNWDYVNAGGLGSFNVSSGVAFVDFIVSFEDLAVEQGKTYHLSFNFYGGLSDGFYSFDSELWHFSSNNQTIQMYNLTMTGSGNYRNIDFDFYMPYDTKTFQLRIYNNELPVLYYSWSGASQFGCIGITLNKTNDNTDALINQNDIIIGQNQQQIEEQEKTNEKLDDLKEQEKETYDYLTDDTPPSSDISALGNVQGLLPPGPVDSLLNIPFKFLSVINSSFGGVCVPLTGEFVYDSTLTLPCFSEMFYDEVPSYLLNFLSLIPASFILIKYLKHLYKKVDRAVSLETTADDEWGVL